MEDIVFQTYGTFILTLAGFVLPIITIAMSAFPEGVKLLRQTYENEQKQADKNLSDELEKQKSNKKIDYNILEKNIATLKSTEKKARTRLQYLSPQYILLQSTISVGICLVAFLAGISFYMQPLYIPVMLFSISLISLIRALIIFSNSIMIIIEASTEVQNIRRTAEEKTLELLTTLVDNSKANDKSLFVNPKDVQIHINDELITTGKVYPFSVNNKHKLKLSLVNSSEYMLKTVELGFTFPPDLLVEGSSITSVYTGDKEKIIRFKYDHLQSNLNYIMRIDITFLKTGTFDVDAFVKGENLKNKQTKFKIKVVD